MTVKTDGAKGNLSSRLLILIFVILAAGILVAGYLFYSSYEKNYRAQVEHQLSAIGDPKAGELEEISKNKGKLYDTEVVDTCLDLFHEKAFKFKG
jgi:flagellar basal body-associated protein FliL